MRKQGKELTLSPVQTVFKSLIQFIFYVLEHPCPGIHYPPVNQWILVVVPLLTFLTDKVLHICLTLVRKNGGSTDGTSPLYHTHCLVIYPSLNHPVKNRVIDKIEIL